MLIRARLFAAAALAALLPIASASAAVVQVYNQNNPIDDTDLPQGGWGDYQGFSVRFDDPAFTRTGTLPGTLLLSDLSVLRAATVGGTAYGNASQVVMKVYTSENADPASWIGDSTNIANMAGGISETSISFTFDNLALSPTTTYYFYFSNAPGDPNAPGYTAAWAGGRMRVSNNANITYGSGNIFDAAFAPKDTAFDAVFVATFVPEPASLALMGMGGLMLLRRRRA